MCAGVEFLASMCLLPLWLVEPAGGAEAGGLRCTLGPAVPFVLERDMKDSERGMLESSSWEQMGKSPTL